MKIRAKLQLESVRRMEYGEEWEFCAVCGDGSFGPNGESEDNTFSFYTPTARLIMTVTNPALLGTMSPGEKYYIDFTKA